jgi:type IV pilus assembly protein PilN
MIRINLLKPEKKDVLPSPSAAPTKEAKTERPSSTPPLILLLTVVAIAALAFTQRNSLTRERNLLETASTEKRKLQSVLAKLEKLEKERETRQRKVQLITVLRGQQDTAVKIIDALSRNLPDWVWLTEATFDGTTVKIRGKATNNTLIAEYVAGLERSGILNSVTPTDITQRTLRSQQVLEFTLTSNVILPPGLPQPAPAPGVKPKGKQP